MSGMSSAPTSTGEQPVPAAEAVAALRDAAELVARAQWWRESPTDLLRHTLAVEDANRVVQAARVAVVGGK